jgi:hypothetical protein
MALDFDPLKYGARRLQATPGPPAAGAAGRAAGLAEEDVPLPTPTAPAAADGRGITSGLLQSLAGATPEASRRGIIPGLASGVGGAAQLAGDLARGEMAVVSSPGLRAARVLGGPLGLLANPALRQMGAGVARGQLDQFARAKEALGRVFQPRPGASSRGAEAVTGLVEAGLRTTAGLLPVLGPQTAEAAEQIAAGAVSGETGDVREGVGKAAGTVLSALALRKAPFRKIAPITTSAHGIAKTVAEASRPGLLKEIASELEKFSGSSFVGKTRFNKFREFQQGTIQRAADSVLDRISAGPVEAGKVGLEVTNEIASTKGILKTLAASSNPQHAQRTMQLLSPAHRQHAQALLQRFAGQPIAAAARALLLDFDRKLFKEIAARANATQFEQVPGLLAKASPDDIRAFIPYLIPARLQQMKRSLLQDVLDRSIATTDVTDLDYLSGNKALRTLKGDPLTRSTLGVERLEAVFSKQELADFRSFLREVKGIKPSGASRGTAVNLMLVTGLASGAAVGSTPIAAAAAATVGSLWAVAQIATRPGGLAALRRLVRAVKAGNKTQALLASAKTGELYREGVQQALAHGEPIPDDVPQ